MKIKRIIALALVLVMTFAIAACNNTQNNPAKANELTVCVGPDPQTIDPALNSAVDGSIMLTNAFSGLYGWDYDANGTLVVVADSATEVVKPTALDGGKYQYVITLKEGLKWSNGDEVKASDFVYAWNRAVDPATGADYQYIFDVIDGYDPETPNLNIKADDATRTITIVTAAYCSYFDQLLAFPTYFPVNKAVVEANPETWATKPETYVSNGAFKMSEWTVGDKITFVKNENYWDASKVKLEKLSFALSDDDDAIFANFENGTYGLMNLIPVTQIPVLKADPNRMNVDFFIGNYIGTYYLEFNVDMSFKPGLTNASSEASAWEGWDVQKNADVRHALALLIDRNYIVNQISQGGEQPANGFVPAGMDDGTGKIFRDEVEAWWSVAEADYQKNVDEAIAILKKYYDYDEAAKKFTNFPTFEYSVNPTSNNLAMCAAIKDMWDDYGIETTVDQRTWSVIQTALTKGDFTMSRLGWIADYNDPVNFLEIVLSTSGNNHPHLGSEGIGGSAAGYGVNGDQTWADAFDTIVKKVKTESDPAKRAQLMYEAEELIRDTYSICPIYFYTQPYMASTSLKDFIYSPLGWISFKTAYIEGAEAK